MKTCLRCEQEGEFGRDKSRADLTNVYCKRCCRETVYLRRRGVEQPTPVVLSRVLAWGRLSKEAKENRVMELIASGAKTQDAIRLAGRIVNEDELPDLLATLILVEGKVGTKLNGERREYFVRVA